MRKRSGLRNFLAVFLALVLCFGSVLAVSAADPEASERPYTEWAAGTAYKVGDLVSYNGKIYECTYAHSSHAGWEPAEAFALWSERADVEYVPVETEPATPGVSEGTIV